MDKIRGAHIVFNVTVIAEVVLVVESTIAKFVESSATVEPHKVQSAGNVDVAQPQCVDGANATVAHVPER